MFYQRKKRQEEERIKGLADKLGEKACPFNALYWDFFARHEERLKGNFRLGMVYKNLNRMTDDARAAIAEKAATVRSNLDDL